MSSFEVASAASQASGYHDFKIFPARTNRAGAPKQPAEYPRAAFSNSNPGASAPAILICRFSAKLLFELNFCACFLKLLFEAFSVVLGCTFLNGRRRTFDRVLGLFQTKSCDRTDSLDHSHFVFTET